MRNERDTKKLVRNEKRYHKISDIYGREIGRKENLPTRLTKY